jgi:hypothetical protein
MDIHYSYSRVSIALVIGLIAFVVWLWLRDKPEPERATVMPVPDRDAGENG